MTARAFWRANKGLLPSTAMSDHVRAVLEGEYRRLKGKHLLAIRRNAARAVLGPSVIRVFEPGTVTDVMPVLSRIKIEKLLTLADQEAYSAWFDQQVRKVANKLRRRNAHNARVNPGIRWGHATKIVALFVREIIERSRAFSDQDARRMAHWLYVPVDSIVMGRLQELGVRLEFTRIKEIDTREKFYGVQALLGQAARAVGVPRVWFDDNWLKGL